MARLFRLTRCPYCRRKISFFGAMILKTKGEYCCTNCKCISNVVIHRSIYGIASFACVAAMLILVLYLSFGNHGSLLGILYVLIPFLLFYIMIPFFVRLEPCNDKSAEKRIRYTKADPIIAENRKIKLSSTNPIELDVGDDFTTSFFNVKSESSKNSEEDSDIKINEKVGEFKDISSISSEESEEENKKVKEDDEITEEKNSSEEISEEEKPENNDDENE